MTALRTSLAGIFWINEKNWNASELSFVDNFGSQIIERPISMSCSLRASNNSCLTDTAQIFKSDSPLSALCFFYETFANQMVSVRLKSGLLSRDFLKFALCGFSSFLLQVLTAMLKFMAVFINSLTAELFTVAVRSDIYNTEINTYHPVNINLFSLFNFTGHKQIEFIFYITQITFSPLTTQQLKLTFASREWDMLSTVNRPDGYLFMFKVERKDAVVKSDCPMLFKEVLRLAVNLIGISYFGDTSDNYLSRKLKRVPNFPINHFVQRKLTEHINFPRPITDIITSGIRCLNSFEKGLRLFRRRQELNLCSQFHTFSISQTQSFDKRGGGASSPLQASGVSALQFL